MKEDKKVGVCTICGTVMGCATLNRGCGHSNIVWLSRDEVLESLKERKKGFGTPKDPEKYLGNMK